MFEHIVHFLLCQKPSLTNQAGDNRSCRIKPNPVVCLLSQSPDRADKRRMAADRKIHRLFVCIFYPPNDFYCPALQPVAYGQAKIKRIFLLCLRGLVKFKPDLLFGFLHRLKIHIPRKSVLGHRVCPTLIDALLITVISNQREKHRGRPFPESRISFPQILQPCTVIL